MTPTLNCQNQNPVVPHLIAKKNDTNTKLPKSKSSRASFNSKKEMTPTLNCQNQNPVVPHLEGEAWILIPLAEANASDTPYFQYASSTCQATGTPATINGFTYGEVFICFMLLIFSMALIFNFLFNHFVKNI